MKHYTLTILTGLFLLAMMGLQACTENITPDYTTRDVELQVDIVQVSTGFVEVKVKTSRHAYYYVGIDAVDPEMYDTLRAWGGDSMIVNRKIKVEDGMTFLGERIKYDKRLYQEWRDSLANKGELHVADFSSYKIFYMAGDHYFDFLRPDALYWVYAFVMDIKTDEPVGDLYLKTIHTTTESIYSNIRFNYRVDGYWDYCYPIDITTGQVVTTVPWVGESVCLDDVDTTLYVNPGAYFDYRFRQQDPSSRILRGIYAHQNDGIGDHTTKTHFHAGKTYYTGFCIFDGMRNKTAYDIYKFRWDGEDTKLFLTDEDSDAYHW